MTIFVLMTILTDRGAVADEEPYVYRREVIFCSFLSTLRHMHRSVFAWSRGPISKTSIFPEFPNYELSTCAFAFERSDIVEFSVLNFFCHNNSQIESLSYIYIPRDIMSSSVRTTRK